MEDVGWLLGAPILKDSVKLIYQSWPRKSIQWAYLLFMVLLSGQNVSKHWGQHSSPRTCQTGFPNQARSVLAESVTRTRVVARAGLRWSATTRPTTSFTSWVWWATVSSVTRVSQEFTQIWRILGSSVLYTAQSEKTKDFVNNDSIVYEINHQYCGKLLYTNKYLSKWYSTHRSSV